MFDDLLEANQRYVDGFADGGLSGIARRGLAVLTCIDSRIDPLTMLGLVKGDAKIIRNAGARVTDDSIRSLVLATNLLNASRVCVIQHTDCAVGHSSNEEIASQVTAAIGIDASAWNFRATTDQTQALRDDVALLRECPLIPPQTQIGAFLYDVHTGQLSLVTTGFEHSPDGPEAGG